MKGIKSRWPVFLLAILIILTIVTIKIHFNSNTDILIIERVALIIILEIFFFGILFRVYEPEFFTSKWRWEHFFQICIPMLLTSIFFFIQTSTFLTYLTWISWIIATFFGILFLYPNSTRSWTDIILTVLLSIWITGLEFPMLGSIKGLGLYFSSNLYLNIPLLRWFLDLRIILSLLFFSSLLIRPFFTIEWKLEKLGPETSFLDMPEETNPLKMLIKSINNGITRASNYLNRIILNIKILAKRYWSDLLSSLKQIKSKTISIFLMTASLASILIVNSIIQILSDQIFAIMKSSTLSSETLLLSEIMINTIFVYVILIGNWILFNENIIFVIGNRRNFFKALWQVFSKYIQVLFIMIPGFLFLVSIIAYIIIAFFHLFNSGAFVLPNIYIFTCFSLILIYLLYNRFIKQKSNASRMS